MLHHWLDFVAPAAWLALCLPALARLCWRGFQPRWPWWAQAAAHLLVGSLVLLAGLLLLERDGAMLTYTALVVCGGSIQWLMMRRA